MEDIIIKWVKSIFNWLWKQFNLNLLNIWKILMLVDHSVLKMHSIIVRRIFCSFVYNPHNTALRLHHPLFVYIQNRLIKNKLNN